MHCAAACSWDTRAVLYPPGAWVVLLSDRRRIVAVGWADEQAEMPRAAAARINARFMRTPSKRSAWSATPRRVQVYAAGGDASGTATVSRMSSDRVHDCRVRVLVVEDHAALAERIGEGLRDAGMAVDVVYDGAAALESTAMVDYDVVVLDRDLPRVHGDRVCRALVRGGTRGG